MKTTTHISYTATFTTANGTQGTNNLRLRRAGRVSKEAAIRLAKRHAAKRGVQIKGEVLAY